MALKNRDLGHLRLQLITDGLGDEDRIVDIVSSALAAGLRSVQVREPKWSARLLLRACERLRPALDAVGGWLLVNDRVDVALAGAAHGVQLGHRSLPPATVRAMVGEQVVLGYSAHDADELGRAARDGCDFALLSPVWPTNSKPDAAFLGVERAGHLTAEARLPVLWLGGVDQTTAAELTRLPAEQRPIGIAVRSAIMQAPDVEQATRRLLDQLPRG
ncbi:MAG TPA: thiamine phosphate synthase [bacterium]|nr:thiamine phosphate synthase [bacterium]